MKRNFFIQLGSVWDQLRLNHQLSTRKKKIFLITLFGKNMSQSNHIWIAFSALSFGSRCVSDSYSIWVVISAFPDSKRHKFTSATSVIQKVKIIVDVQLARMNELKQILHNLSWYIRASVIVVTASDTTNFNFS